MTKKKLIFFDPTFPPKTAIQIFNVNYLISWPVLFIILFFLHILEVKEIKKKILQISPIPPKNYSQIYPIKYLTQ